MAIQTISGPAFLGRPYAQTGADLVFTPFVLDAADEKYAYVFQAPRAGEIDTLAFKLGTVTTGCTLDVRLETVDPATGSPTGTLADTTSNGAVVVGDGDDDVWKTATLTASATVTQGQFLALVIVWAASGNLEIDHQDDSGIFVESSRHYTPYGSFYTGTWAKQSGVGICTFAVRYDDTAYYAIPGALPLTSAVSESFGSGSSPPERGLRFTLPFPCTLRGFWALTDGNGDFEGRLYDGSDTIIAASTIAVDKDINPFAFQASRSYFLSAPASIAKDTAYTLLLAPTSATTISFPVATVDSAALLGAWPGGTAFHYAARESSTITPTTTKRPLMGLIIDGFDDGAGGAGGGLPIMAGSIVS